MNISIATAGEASAQPPWGFSAKVTVRALFILVTLSICTLQLISGNAPLAGISNWLVPDGQTYHDVMRILATDGLGAMWRILPEQFIGVPVNPLLFIYYYSFYLLFGVAGYFVANQLLILSVAKQQMLVGLLLTPYFLLSLALPSKDLLVLALFMPFVSALFRRRYVVSTLLVMAIFLVRDGAGVVAACCFLATIFSPESGRARLALVAAGAVAIALLNALVYEYLGDAFILARNLNIAQQGEFDLGGAGASHYFIRLFGNATNLAFRPVVSDVSGYIPLVAIAYWISGISLVVCLYYAIRLLWSRQCDKYSSWLAMMFLVSLVAISVNPLVQPRYQLFFVVIMLQQVISKYTLNDILGSYVAASLLSIGAAATYVASGIGLPSPYDWGRMVGMN